MRRIRIESQGPQAGWRVFLVEDGMRTHEIKNWLSEIIIEADGISAVAAVELDLVGGAPIPDKMELVLSATTGNGHC